MSATFIPSVDLKPVQGAPDAAYSAQLETLAPGITGILADTRAPGEAWTDALERVLPVLASTDQQRELLAVQIARAKAGSAPVDVANAAADNGAVGASGSALMLGVFGLAALYLFSKRG